MTKRDVDVTPTMGEGAQSGKPYASPQLVRYGNISEVTRTVGNKGGADGGSGGNMDKTGA